mgnify:CR=1 FL=1
MHTAKPKKAVYILDDPEKILLLADFTRWEILRLLSIRPMTEAQMSKLLGLTRAAVGYHLHQLLKAGLIRIEKTEPEEHGILQKFYSPVATLFIVDPDRTPEEVLRYFVRLQIERLIGLFSAFQLNHHPSKFSSKTLETLALAMMRQLCEIGRRFTGLETTENVASLEIKIYAEALTCLTKQAEWHDFFQKFGVH